MKKIALISLAILLLATEGFCQSPPFLRNDAGASINGADLSVGSASVDGKGNLATVATDPGSGETQSVIPVSNAVNLNGVGGINAGYAFVVSDSVEAASTTTVINATSHVARVGDSLSFRGGTAGNIGVWTTVSAVTANTITLSNALPTTPAAADSFYILRPTPFSVNNNLGGGGPTTNSLNVAIDIAGQTAATGILKLEDSAAASGDALVGVAGVRNFNLSTLVGNDLDYSGVGVGTYGNVLISPLIDANASGTAWALRGEDNGANSTDTVTPVGYVARDPIIASVSATNDYINPVTDLGGRTITTLAPAGESWQSCSAAQTGTANEPIKTAVPSNRMYVTSISCTNTSAVASAIEIKDGTTVIYRGGVGTQAATGGNWQTTFPVPLRGTVNTGLNFAPITTATSTICCASGYISVN